MRIQRLSGRHRLIIVEVIGLRREDIDRTLNKTVGCNGSERNYFAGISPGRANGRRLAGIEGRVAESPPGDASIFGGETTKSVICPDIGCAALVPGLGGRFRPDWRWIDPLVET